MFVSFCKDTFREVYVGNTGGHQLPTGFAQKSTWTTISRGSNYIQPEGVSDRIGGTVKGKLLTFGGLHV